MKTLLNPARLTAALTMLCVASFAQSSEPYSTGEMTRADELLSNSLQMAEQINNGTSWRQAFANSPLSDFSMNLTGNGGSLSESWALWGKFNYLDFDGDDDVVDFDGNSYGVQVGMDGRLANDLLVGAALSWQTSEVDYDMTEGTNTSKGEHETEMVSFHPYIAGNTQVTGAKQGGVLSQLDWWASLGYGEGDVDMTPKTGNNAGTTTTRDSSLWTIGGGVRTDALSHGTWDFRGRLDLSFSELEVEGEGDAADTEIDATRTRLAVEAQPQGSQTAGGGYLQPTLTAGVRHDGGDGDTGAGLELEANINYAHSPRITAEGNIHVLTLRDDYNEWGVSGTIRMVGGTDGQGLAFSMSPTYGDASGGMADEIFDSNSYDRDAASDVINRTNAEDPTEDYEMQLRSEFQYGMSLTEAGWMNGKLMPYVKTSLSDSTDAYRVGMEWAPASNPVALGDAKLKFDLFGTRENSASTDESVMQLKTTLEF